MIRTKHARGPLRFQLPKQRLSVTDARRFPSTPKGCAAPFWSLYTTLEPAHRLSLLVHFYFAAKHSSHRRDDDGESRTRTAAPFALRRQSIKDDVQSPDL
jgi:hypothetical protein